MELLSIIFNVSFILLLLPSSHGFTSNLFREYIGADLKDIKFTDVPINPNVTFDYILSFAIDYTTSPASPTPTNGEFNVFWFTQHLSPKDVSSIKSQHRNVRVAVSIGGDAVTHNQKAYFAPKSISSWVNNAVTSLTQVIKTFNLDGLDIDYEHFSKDPDTFAECIGQLVTILKKRGVISFASIAPFDDQGPVTSHYMALWKKYGHVIDYVNFQFYAFDKITSVSKFVGLYEEQVSNFKGGQVLASFITDGTVGGLSPQQGFFDACNVLKKEGKLGGIFVWSADDSKKHGFNNELEAQVLMT